MSASDPDLNSNLSCIGNVISGLPPKIESRRLFSFIPSRYGHVASITHATDCLIARIRQFAQAAAGRSPEEDAAALNSYTKALRSLRDDINDENLRMLPETLCATELLGFFEVSFASTDSCLSCPAPSTVSIGVMRRLANFLICDGYVDIEWDPIR